jgi:hypothetical protein
MTEVYFKLFSAVSLPEEEGLLELAARGCLLISFIQKILIVFRNAKNFLTSGQQYECCIGLIESKLITKQF